MKAIVLLISLLVWIQLSAQEEEKNFFPTEERSTEIGLNVTSVISSFVGSNDGGIDPGSFPLVVKFAKNNKAWRLGLGLDFKSQEENNINFFQNKTSITEVFTKVGREWRHKVGKRVLAYYGVDLLFNYENETSNVFISTDFVSLNLTNLGFGGGPVYGLQLALNERVLVSFEGSFYGVVTNSNVKEEFDQNPIFNKDETTWLTDIEMNMPQWLYLVVRF
ncbi:MAG: hypothetical protein AB8B69_25175 [Chitinophagales bacterium]